MSQKNVSHKHFENEKRGSELESLLHSEHTLTVEKMSIGGDGVARLPFKEKSVVVFIPRAAPQDHLKVRISRVEKNRLYGEILSILTPGPSRRTAPCAVAHVCGGCLWQHISEDEQIAQKELLLKELFKKFLPDVTYTLSPTIYDEHKFEYRNRIQLKQLGTQLGYFMHESHDLVDIEDCPIAEGPLRLKISEMKKTLKPCKELRKFELKINQDNQVESYPIGQRGEGLAFSQVNRFINAKLVEKVVDSASGSAIQNLTELYAGSGNFTFPLAVAMPQTQISAIELSSDLTKAAVQRVQAEKKQKQITFFTTKSEVFCRQKGVSSDLVVLDPPRSGCEAEIFTAIHAARTRKVIYVSCHPVSLVRDLGLLLQSKSYKIDHLQIFDMFPQTDHFETLCILSHVES